jgi:hypothetical protein
VAALRIVYPRQLTGRAGAGAKQRWRGDRTDDESLAAVISLLARMNSPVVAASALAARHSIAEIRTRDGRRMAHGATAEMTLRADRSPRRSSRRA